ncbi:MAG: Na+/H+ antiporter subunit E, partial [Spirochaetales bacterium]|nr:Na+/H+ antiporter subunit E [Spirochaetales bacterium]
LSPRMRHIPASTKARQIAASFLILWLVWILFSWTLAPLWRGIGPAGAFALSLIMHPIFITLDSRLQISMVARLWHLLITIPTLIVSLYAASWRVLLAVLRGRTEPGFISFETTLQSDMACVSLANAITFSPGTAVISLEEHHLVVHWLFAGLHDASEAPRRIKGSMERLFGKMWQ